MQVTLSNVVLANNTSFGVIASPASLLRIGSSTIIGNGTGIANGGGTVESLQDNLVRGNATDVTGPLTLIAKI